MGARLVGNKVFRDPAEFVEASRNVFNENETGFVEPEESLDDLIREAAHPTKLPPAAVHRLRALYENRETTSVEATAQQRADMLREFLEKFNPQEWSLLNWWAVQYAIEAPSTDRFTESRICSLLAINWMRFFRAKKRWIEIFRLPKNIHARREAQRKAWKFRDRKGRRVPNERTVLARTP